MSIGPFRVTIGARAGNVLGVLGVPPADPQQPYNAGVMIGAETKYGPAAWSFPYLAQWGDMSVQSPVLPAGVWNAQPFDAGSKEGIILLQRGKFGAGRGQFRLVQKGDGVFVLQTRYDSQGAPSFFIRLPTVSNPHGAITQDASQATLLSINTSHRILEVLHSSLAKADDSVCQGGKGSAAQICFYNHSPSDSTKPVYPDMYPGSVIGFNAYTLGALPKLDSRVDLGYHPFSHAAAVEFKAAKAGETNYLGPPTNSAQTNNVQVSYSDAPDRGCHTQPDGPDTCAKQPGHVCIDNLSCLPGYAAYKFLECVPNKFGGSHTGWQCLKPAFVCDKESKKCIERIDKTTTSQYDSMKDCIMDCEPCKAGFSKITVGGVRGCFRDQNFNFDTSWPGGCGDSGSCPSGIHPDDCNATGGVSWRACCHGGSIFSSPHCNCVDTAPMQPYSFKCMPHGSNPCWQQCTNPKGCAAPKFDCPSGFGRHKDAGCNTTSRFC